jgi:hypothetical protein
MDEPVITIAEIKEIFARFRYEEDAVHELFIRIAQIEGEYNED